MTVRLTREEALAAALRDIYCAYLGAGYGMLNEKVRAALDRDLSKPETIYTLKEGVLQRLERLKRGNDRMAAVLDPLCYYVREYIENEGGGGD